MLGFTCGFSIYFVAIVEPCGFVSTLGKIINFFLFSWVTICEAFEWKDLGFFL